MSAWHRPVAPHFNCAREMSNTLTARCLWASCLELLLKHN